MKYRFFIITLFLLKTLALSAAEFFTDEPKITLEVWGEGINVAISQIGKQSGVMPIISSAVSGGELKNTKLYLSGKKMPLQQTVEWLARALGCRYRVINNEKIMMTPGYDWLTVKKYGVILRNIETLIGIHHPSERREKITRFEKMLGELLKIVSIFEPEFRVRLEEHDATQIKLNAQVPAELKPLFVRAFTALENPGENFTTPKPLLMSNVERQLIEKLNTANVIVAYRERSLQEIINDLSAQSGLNIGFEQARNWSPPTLTLELGTVNIQVALMALAKKLGLANVEMSPPHGVWLSNHKRAWQNMPSREVLWVDNVELKCYSLNALSGKVDGEQLAHWVRNNVFPHIWLDPLATVVYHHLSNNLLIIAPAKTQQAVYNALCLANNNPALLLSPDN